MNDDKESRLLVDVLLAEAERQADNGMDILEQACLDMAFIAADMTAADPDDLWTRAALLDIERRTKASST